MMIYKFNPLSGTLDLVNKEDSTTLKEHHLGVTVQPYNTNTVVDADYANVKDLALNALQPEDIVPDPLQWSSTNW